MPAMMPESSPYPSSLSTLPLSSSAPGATPLNLPLERAPVPAAMEATCVPWPYLSVVSGEVEKFLAAATWPLRSGWVASMPVSSTAMVTPLPSRPAFQAFGAPICWTDVSRLTSRTPSSQRFATPVAVVPSASVSAFHSAAASSRG